jgi:hypothetical protein
MYWPAAVVVLVLCALLNAPSASLVLCVSATSSSTEPGASLVLRVSAAVPGASHTFLNHSGPLPFQVFRFQVPHPGRPLLK